MSVQQQVNKDHDDQNEPERGEKHIIWGNM